MFNKIKRLFKATISIVPNYYSDYESAYEEGWAEGYDEGIKEGWNSGKSEGKIAWRDLYNFLVERGQIYENEEISTFDMFERLYDHERDLKSSIDFWKEKANAGDKDKL